MPSEIRVDKISSTASPYDPVFSTTGGALSHRNCVINGGMQVFQRGASATSVTGYAWKAGDADRFRFQPYNCGTYTIGTVDGPLAEAGIKNAWKMDCTTADASPASGDEVKWSYAFEGQDLQHFRKGTASAKPMMLSFWIRARIQNVANPTFNIHVRDLDNNREVGLQYTVTASADTDSGWQRKTLTIPADTTGQFDDDNAKSMEFFWWFGGGTNQTGGTTISAWRANGSATDQRANSTGNVNLHTNNYIHITGVQLEVGTVATPFEHRSLADELQRCHRYYQRLAHEPATPVYNGRYSLATGVWYQAAEMIVMMPYAPKRAVPSITSTSADFMRCYYAGGSQLANEQNPFDNISIDSARLVCTMAANGTAGHGAYCQISGSSEYVEINAEL